jgi:hypothetical protein
MSFEEVVDEYTDITAGGTISLPIDQLPSYIAESLPDTNYDQPETAKRCFDTLWKKLKTLTTLEKLGSSREYRTLAVEDIWVAALCLNNKRRYDKVIQRTLARLGCPAHDKSGCRIYRGKLFDQKGVPTPEAGQQFINQLPEIWTTDNPASFRRLFSEFVRECLKKASKTKQQRLQELQAWQASPAHTPSFERRESRPRSRTMAPEVEGTICRSAVSPTTMRRASRHSIMPPNPRKRPKRISSSGSEIVVRPATLEGTTQPSEGLGSESHEAFPEFTYKDDEVDGDYRDTPSPSKVTVHIEEQLRNDLQRRLAATEEPEGGKNVQMITKKRAREASRAGKSRTPNHDQRAKQKRPAIWCEQCLVAYKCCAKHKKCRDCRKIGCSNSPLSSDFILELLREGPSPTPDQTTPRGDPPPQYSEAMEAPKIQGKLESPIEEPHKLSLKEEFELYSSTKYDVVLRSIRAACSEITQSRAGIDKAIRKRAAVEREHDAETKGTRRELVKVESMRRHHEELQAKNEELRALYPDLATFSGVTWNEEGYQRKLREKQEKLRLAGERVNAEIQIAEREEQAFRAKEESDVEAFKGLQSLIAKIGNEIGYEEFVQLSGPS